MRNLFLQTRLRQDASERVRVNVVTRMPRDRSAARFRWMLELPMTAFRRNEVPPIVSKEFEDITDFHDSQMIG